MNALKNFFYVSTALVIIHRRTRSFCYYSVILSEANKVGYAFVILARDVASYNKRFLLSDSVSVAVSACLSAARFVRCEPHRLPDCLFFCLFVCLTTKLSY